MRLWWCSLIFSELLAGSLGPHREPFCDAASDDLHLIFSFSTPTKEKGKRKKEKQDSVCTHIIPPVQKSVERQDLAGLSRSRSLENFAL